MDIVRVPVFSVEQPIGRFYIGVIRADELLRICHFDYRRMQYNAGGYPEFLGIQRQVSEKRVADIRRYPGTVDACFPTSVVISVDERCVSIRETDREGFLVLEITKYIDDVTPELSIELDQVAIIIDGQHRLKGLEDALAESFELSVSIFVGIDENIQASLFSIVNLAQTKVNRSLVYDLFSLARNRSPEKTCHEIAVALDSLPESPFHDRIKRLGIATEDRFGETLSQATVVKGLLPYISKDPILDRDIGKRYGFWEPELSSDGGRKIFFEFFRKDQDELILKIMMNYFNAVRDRWLEAWTNTGSGNIINRTNGYNGFMRFLRPAYLYYTESTEVVSESQFRSLFGKVKLENEDFNPTNFLPGSSGATALFHRLVADTGIDT